MKFLVVDDSPTMRRIVINALKKFGWTEVVEAGDGIEAVEHLKVDCINLIAHIKSNKLN
jgi:two-component system chemotaxis response regulator CheY